MITITTTPTTIITSYYNYVYDDNAVDDDCRDSGYGEYNNNDDE